MEVRAQQPGCGWEGERQPAQLRHHGQLLRGQARVHGGPRGQEHRQRNRDQHLAGPGPRWEQEYL